MSRCLRVDIPRQATAGSCAAAGVDKGCWVASAAVLGSWKVEQEAFGIGRSGWWAERGETCLCVRHAAQQASRFNPVLCSNRHQNEPRTGRTYVMTLPSRQTDESTVRFPLWGLLRLSLFGLLSWQRFALSSRC
jgi:hypothetical protein